MHIFEGDAPNTTRVTTYGSYENLVMSFGLTSAPATFCNIMNNVLYEYLNYFMVIQLDDIIIYSKTLEHYLLYLRIVLQRLGEYQLYVKIEKCELICCEIKSLSLENYYQNFTIGYSKKTTPLTDLLKKMLSGFGKVQVTRLYIL